MPVIPVFFGIVIRMFDREHGAAHFHAEHHGQQATVTFDGKLLAGTISSRTALRLIAEWAIGHRPELEANRDRVSTGRLLERIEPLDQRGRMQFLPVVTRAEYRGGHRIHVTFNDGKSGTIDVSRWLEGPVFEPLEDTEYFQRFFLDGGTVSWPNGADIAPETLYEQARSSAAA